MTAPVNDNVLFNITMLLRGGRGRRDKASGEEREEDGGGETERGKATRQDGKSQDMEETPEMATVVALLEEGGKW